MAIVATPLKVSVDLLLNNGSTSSGGIKTKTLKLGGTSQKINSTVYLQDTAAARTKAMAIGVALEECLAKTVYQFQDTITNELTSE